MRGKLVRAAVAVMDYLDNTAYIVGPRPVRASLVALGELLRNLDYREDVKMVPAGPGGTAGSFRSLWTQCLASW